MAQDIVSRIRKLRQKFETEFEKDFEYKHSYIYAFTSANLLHLLPELSFKKHALVLKEILFHLQLLDLEEQNPLDFISNFRIEDPSNVLQKAREGKVHMFCGFHYGAYSLLPSLLTINDIDFGFFANQTLTDRKEKDFLSAHQKLCRDKSCSSDMQLINVEQKKGIWKAIQLIKSGYSIISYIDGNDGIGQIKSTQTHKVTFLNQSVKVRKGSVALAKKYKMPLVPIFIERKGLERIFHIVPPLDTEKDNVDKLVAQLYSLLSHKIQEHPMSWEGWLFINKCFSSIPSLKSSAKPVVEAGKHYILNKERYALIYRKDKKTLLDKKTYQTFAVSDLLYEVIKAFENPYLISEFGKTFTYQNKKVGTDAIRTLVEKEILVLSQDFHKLRLP